MAGDVRQEGDDSMDHYIAAKSINHRKHWCFGVFVADKWNNYKWIALNRYDEMLSDY